MATPSRPAKSELSSAEQTLKDERKAKRIAKRVAGAEQQISAGIKALADSGEFRNTLRMMTLRPRYSANNKLLIRMQAPDATHVMSQSDWKRVGRTPIEDAKRLAILTPGRHYKYTYPVTGEEEWRPVPGAYNTATVYDVSQTEGRDVPPLPDPVPLTGTSDESRELGTRLIEWCHANKLDVSDDVPVGVDASYDEANKTVRVRPGADQDQRVLLLAQEVARASMLSDAKRAKKLTAEDQELICAGAAYAICAGGGLDAGEATFPQLVKLTADEKRMRRILASIQQVSHDVLGISSRGPSAEKASEDAAE